MLVEKFSTAEFARKRALGAHEISFKANQMKIHQRFAIASTLSVLCLGALIPAHSQSTYFTESNKTVARIGAANGSYVSFVEPLTQNCQWGLVYIAADKKNLYVHLLAAKLSGRRLSRIDYTQPGGPGTQCNAELVEFAD